MAVITVSDFGGELPRVAPRDLPTGAAQTNLNLLATNNDFRPVKGSTQVIGVLPDSGTVTLYRGQRSSDGALFDDIKQGWTYSAAHMSIVPGQIPDDTTERTYYSFDDGSQPPRVKNSAGQDFLLGLPPPPKPSVSILKATKYTQKQAQEWRDSVFNKAVYDAVIGSLSTDQVSARFTVSGGWTQLGTYSGASRAGITHLIGTGATRWEYFPLASSATTLSQRGAFEPWNIMLAVPLEYACAEGIRNPQLNGIVAGNTAWLGFPAFPLWGALNTTLLSAALKKLTSLQGDVLLNDKQVSFLVDSFSVLLSPDHYVEIKLARASLDSAYLDYSQTAARIISDSFIPTLNTGELQSAFEARLNSWKNLQSSSVTAMVTAWNTAADISHKIEAAYVALHDDLSNVLNTWMANIPLERTEANVDGLIVIDSDPVIDVRFYLTTYVSSWGEESSPSEPSSRMELDWNDLAVIDQPEIPSGYSNVTKWRLYRSNSGSNSASFQFVSEQSFGYKPATPTVDLSGLVGADWPGYGDKDKWRDIVATWMIYRKKGLYSGASVDTFLDTSKLSIGDTARQSRYVDGLLTYAVTKTWNGGDWVMQSVPSVASVNYRLCYVDGKYGSTLGEVCPTLTWLPPPYRQVVADPMPRIPSPKGSAPYLRGFTNMPNGVMAGFVDNYVAFCEPYSPYAWPVEYQIPIEFPVVGLCAFGQSLLVGTKANPYIISGTDSASMSARKINVSQSCVSARSMVSAMGGVFYASPDGYCFASESSVEVATTGLFSNEDWTALNPSSIFAVVHDSVLYFWYSGNGGGCYGIDMVAKKLVRMSASAGESFGATSAFEDVVTDAVYVAREGKLFQLFDGSRLTGTWKSGKMTFPRQTPLSWVRALSDYSAPVTLRWYGDGVLRHTVDLTDVNPKRLPAGRYLEHEIEVVSKARVSSVTLASTTEELQAT